MGHSEASEVLESIGLVCLYLTYLFVIIEMEKTLTFGMGFYLLMTYCRKYLVQMWVGGIETKQGFYSKNSTGEILLCDWECELLPLGVPWARPLCSKVGVHGVQDLT